VPALLDAPPLGHDASAAGSEHDDLLVTRTLDDSPPSAVVLETGGRTSRIQTWWLGGAGLVVVLGGALMLTPRSEAGRQDDLQEVASAEIDPDVQPVRPVSPVPASPPEVAPSENHVVHAA